MKLSGRSLEGSRLVRISRDGISQWSLINWLIYSRARGGYLSFFSPCAAIGMGLPSTR
ncbi:hypothetical protein [Methanosarcina lacustris]|uniref:hypothetical protein n=1 Tax=Methanosarcina lacustris TaxID=170861 RepID=UPI001E4113C9|nr:hypothetical protein [Methanosarcina lacustris]